MNNEPNTTTPPSTTAVAVRPANTNAVSVGLNLASVKDLREFAADIAASGIIGQITATQAEISLVAMRDDGISIVDFKRKYQWVGNELSTRPNWLLGEFKRRGGKYQIKEASREACEIVFTDKDGSSYDCRITMDDMLKTDVPKDKNGGIKKNWKNFPDDMLFARVCGKGLRRIAPELMGGVYTDGEAMDFDTPPAPLPPPPAPKHNFKKVVPINQPQESSTVVAEVVDTPNAEPVESPIRKAARKAKEVAKVKVEEAVDLAVCPVKGKLFGKRWDEMSNETLEAVLKCSDEQAPGLTADHRKVVTDILTDRNA